MDSPFECNQCQEMFCDNYSLQEHQKTHQFEESSSEYDPPSAGEESASESEPDQLYGDFYCSECGISFHRQDLLRRHAKQQHKLSNVGSVATAHHAADVEGNADAEADNAKDAPHCCHTCGKSFPSALELLAHAEIHARFPPFKYVIKYNNISNMVLNNVWRLTGVSCVVSASTRNRPSNGICTLATRTSSSQTHACCAARSVAIAKPWSSTPGIIRVRSVTRAQSVVRIFTTKPAWSATWPRIATSRWCARCATKSFPMGAPFPIIVIRTAQPRRGNCFPATSAAKPSALAARSRFMCAFIRESVLMAAGTAGRPSPMAVHCASMSGFIRARSLMPVACVRELSINVLCCASIYAHITRGSIQSAGRTTAQFAQPTYPHPMSLFSISFSTATQTQPNNASQLWVAVEIPCIQSNTRFFSNFRLVHVSTSDEGNCNHMKLHTCVPRTRMVTNMPATWIAVT